MGISTELQAYFNFNFCKCSGEIFRHERGDFLLSIFPRGALQNARPGTSDASSSLHLSHQGGFLKSMWITSESFNNLESTADVQLVWMST